MDKPGDDKGLKGLGVKYDNDKSMKCDYNMYNNGPGWHTVEYKAATVKDSSKRHKFITKDSGERQEFGSGMRRDISKGKIRYDLIYIPLLDRWAELMGRGAEKYGENNWQKAKTKAELARFRQSAFRHFMKWFKGLEDEDHAAAVLFNIAGVEYVKEKMNARSSD